MERHQLRRVKHALHLAAVILLLSRELCPHVLGERERAALQLAQDLLARMERLAGRIHVVLVHLTHTAQT